MLKLVRKFDGKTPRELRDALVETLTERIASIDAAQAPVKGRKLREAYGNGQREALDGFKRFLEEIEFTE